MYDFLAPIAPAALNRQVGRSIRRQISPLEASINAQTRAGSRNISGIANALAQSLGAFQGQQADIYGRARSDLGALDTQLADRLGMAGNQGADTLRSSLALSGQNPAGADALAAAGHGAAGAGYARGSAEVGALRNRQAGAEDYAARLPGLARLSGLQNVSQRQAQGQTELASLHAKVPSMIAQALADAQQREYEKAVARLGFQGTVFKTQAQNQRTQAQIDAANARSSASQAGANQRSGNTTSVAQQRANETARHNRVTEKQRRKDRIQRANAAKAKNRNKPY